MRCCFECREKQTKLIYPPRPGLPSSEFMIHGEVMIGSEKTQMCSSKYRRMSFVLILVAGIVAALCPLAAQQSPPRGVYNSLADALQNPDGVTTLILDKTPLETLPASIGKLHKLRTLILHRNGLKQLPDELGSLKNLKSIYVGGSPALDFKKVIDILAQLPSLEGVGLDDNNMHAVPHNIASLKVCKRLGLSSNRLTVLPSQIVSLTALESLDLYNNNLATLPADIRELKSLKKVFIKGSGLSSTMLRDALPGVEIVESTPPELYLQLK
jgi:Leucine-rich repeat (LRR) protein